VFKSIGSIVKVLAFSVLCCSVTVGQTVQEETLPPADPGGGANPDLDGCWKFGTGVACPAAYTEGPDDDCSGCSSSPLPSGGFEWLCGDKDGRDKNQDAHGVPFVPVIAAGPGQNGKSKSSSTWFMCAVDYKCADNCQIDEDAGPNGEDLVSCTVKAGTVKSIGDWEFALTDACVGVVVVNLP
jgi:hypothetical protein